jgi:hypothetical protein
LAWQPIIWALALPALLPGGESLGSTCMQYAVLYVQPASITYKSSLSKSFCPTLLCLIGQSFATLPLSALLERPTLPHRNGHRQHLA